MFANFYTVWIKHSLFTENFDRIAKLIFIYDMNWTYRKQLWINAPILQCNLAGFAKKHTNNIYEKWIEIQKKSKNYVMKYFSHKIFGIYFKWNIFPHKRVLILFWYILFLTIPAGAEEIIPIS